MLVEYSSSGFPDDILGTDAGGGPDGGAYILVEGIEDVVRDAVLM